MSTSEEKSPEFYKNYYETNRVRLLQYESLRECFNIMVDDTLGKGYYNMAMDVYTCDEITCSDITTKANRTWIQRLLG